MLGARVFLCFGFLWITQLLPQVLSGDSSEHIHIKLHVPQIIKKHTHTRTVFKHHLVKPKHASAKSLTSVRSEPTFKLTRKTPSHAIGKPLDSGRLTPEQDTWKPPLPEIRGIDSNYIPKKIKLSKKKNPFKLLEIMAEAQAEGHTFSPQSLYANDDYFDNDANEHIPEYMLSDSQRFSTQDNPRLTGSDTRFGAQDNPRFTASDTRFASQDSPRFSASHTRLAAHDSSRFSSSETRFPSSETRFPSSETRFPSSETRFPSSETRFPSSETRFPSSETRFSASDTRFGPLDAQRHIGFTLTESPRFTSPDTSRFVPSDLYQSADNFLARNSAHKTDILRVNSDEKITHPTSPSAFAPSWGFTPPTVDASAQTYDWSTGLTNTHTKTEHKKKKLFSAAIDSDERDFVTPKPKKIRNKNRITPTLEPIDDFLKITRKPVSLSNFTKYKNKFSVMSNLNTSI